MDRNLTLKQTQIDDLSFFMREPRALNTSKPGAGKTPTSCVLTFWVWHRHRQQTIWVQPNSIIKKNYEELLRWTDFTEDDICMVIGTPSARMEMYRKRYKVYLMGPDIFKKEFEALLNENPNVGLLVADEIQRFWGNPESQRTVSFFLAMNRIERYVGMSGTLIDGSYRTAYPHIHIIEPRYYGGYINFKKMHELRAPDGSMLGWGNAERLAIILKKHSVFHSYKDIYGAEPYVFKSESITLEDTHENKYREFHDKAMLELEDAEILFVEISAVWSLRARQILCHPETFNIKTTPAKDEWLADLFTLKENIVIFSVFMPEQARLVQLARTCGRKVALINSEVSNPKRFKIDEDYRAGRLDTLVVSPGCAGFGYNWGHTHRMVLCSTGYNDSEIIQALFRGLRGDRAEPMIVHIPRYFNTIEDRVWQIIKRKSIEANRIDNTRPIISF